MYHWMRYSWVERVSDRQCQIATVLGSIPAPPWNVLSEGRQMKLQDMEKLKQKPVHKDVLYQVTYTYKKYHRHSKLTSQVREETFSFLHRGGQRASYVECCKPPVTIESNGMPVAIRFWCKEKEKMFRKKTSFIKKIPVISFGLKNKYGMWVLNWYTLILLLQNFMWAHTWPSLWWMKPVPTRTRWE
jgi:hypothetical protein